MKLGIVVVYMINAENEKLLELHLSQIEKYTEVPYTIYGSANRSTPEIRERLQRHSKVRICECLSTDLDYIEEHAYYLELLTNYAIQDGASHIVTMHVDSFPIRLHWVEELAVKLSSSCAFATIKNEETACLFFAREFYIKYHPTFILSPKEYASSQYWQYEKEYRTNRHSGIGYGFKAYMEGLSWYYLKDSTKSEDGGKIYDDMIFHLVNTFSLGNYNDENIQILKKASYVKIVEKVKLMAGLILSRHQRKLLRKIFSLPIHYFIDRPSIQWLAAKNIDRKKELLADPEIYIQSLRSGRDH